MQRYDTKENWVDGGICDFGPDDHGQYVRYTDHLTDKQAALDAQQAAHAAEVERLTAERDAAVRERDAAVEALRNIVELDVRGDDESNKCESWGMHLEMAVNVARAALAKIGERR